MKKQYPLQTTVKTFRTYKVPMPERLRGTTASEIFSESPYYDGLMSKFFDWSRELLMSTWPGYTLSKSDFDDYFHDSFEMLFIEGTKGKARATSPEMLFSFLRAIFRNHVYLQKLKQKSNLSFGEDYEMAAPAEYDPDYDPTNLCLTIDKIIHMKNILTKTDLAFWNEYKKNPDQKSQILLKLNITSQNYDTLKHRILRKLSRINLRNFLY